MAEAGIVIATGSAIGAVSTIGTASKDIYKHFKEMKKNTLCIDVSNHTDSMMICAAHDVINGKVDKPPRTIKPGGSSDIFSHNSHDIGIQQKLIWQLQEGPNVRVTCGIGLDKNNSETPKQGSYYLSVGLESDNLIVYDEVRMELVQGRNESAYVSRFGYTVIGTMGTSKHTQVLIDVLKGEIERPRIITHDAPREINN